MTQSSEVSEQNLLDLLVSEWQDKVVGNVAPNACILGARVASEILSYFGVRHQVLVARVIAVNDLMLSHMEQGTDPIDFSPSAWSVAIGFPDNHRSRPNLPVQPGFNGHVVILTDNFYLDLTASQMNRPFRKILVDEPLLVPLAEIGLRRLREDDEIEWAFIPLKEGKLLFRFLEDSPSTTTYKKSRDWRIHYTRFAGPMIRSIKQSLKHTERLSSKS